MKRQNLPLSGLRAFEAAARHQSFTAAAEELHVTHGAVSQQIKRLEVQTGLALFERHNRGVRLTEAGAALLPVLSGAFDQIGAALDSLSQPTGRGLVSVTTTPYLAARWLIPHLTGWRQTTGARDVDLHPTLDFVDIAAGACDIGIRCGQPPWPGLTAELLLPIHLTPLCAPTLLQSGPQLRRPRDLAQHTLIHADIHGHARGEEWQTWLAAAGEASVADGGGLQFREPALALQAAADGLGVAMGYLEFVQDDLASGRLVQPFRLAVRHSFSYYLVTPSARPPKEQAGRFAAWLRQEAEALLG